MEDNASFECSINLGDFLMSKGVYLHVPACFLGLIRTCLKSVLGFPPVRPQPEELVKGSRLRVQWSAAKPKQYGCNDGCNQ